METHPKYSKVGGTLPMVFMPHREEDFQRLVEVLDRLIDLVGEDESHPLTSMMEVVGVLVAKYEEEYVPELEEDNTAKTTDHLVTEY